MNTTSNEIQTELDRTSARLGELTEMRDGIKGKLETLQKGFVGGKTSLDDLQTEQGKLTILNESIKALEVKQTELHDAFQKANLSESRAETLRQMKIIAGQAETAFGEYVELRAGLDKTIERDGGKIVDAFSLFRAKQKEFERAFRELAPGVINFRPVPADAIESYGQAAAELKEIGLDGKSLELITSSYQNLPQIDFGECIHTVKQIIGNKRDRQEQQARKAAQAETVSKPKTAQLLRL
jgi:chromosome segregation ATPase